MPTPGIIWMLHETHTTVGLGPIRSVFRPESVEQLAMFFIFENRFKTTSFC